MGEIKAVEHSPEDVVLVDATDSVAVHQNDIGAHLDALNTVEQGLDMVEQTLQDINDQDSLEKLCVAVESAALHLERGFEILGIPGMVQKHLIPAMESNLDDRDVQFARMLESLQADLVTANEGLINETIRAVTDWWEYGKEACAKQVAEAETLIAELDSLSHTPRDATVKYGSADNICYRGSLRGKDIVEGYTMLLGMQNRFEDDFKKIFVGYLHDAARIFEKTASHYDWYANRPGLMLGAGALIAILNSVITAVVGVGMMTYWLRAQYKVRTNETRVEGMKEVVTLSIQNFRNFVKDYRNTFGKDRMSGDRAVVLNLRADGKFDGVAIVKTAKVESSTTADTLSLDEMRKILKAIIDGESTFKHRSDFKEELFLTIDKEVVNMFKSGSTNKQEALKRAGYRVKSFGLKLYWKPLTELSKVQLSVNRSLLAAVRANIKAY